MDSKPIETYQVHEYLRSKLCSLYENDCIFDKFECAWSGNDRSVPERTDFPVGLDLVWTECSFRRNKWFHFSAIVLSSLEKQGIEAFLGKQMCAIENKSKWMEVLFVCLMAT